MLTQTQGQIYLSNARGLTLTKTHRSFHTFNDGNYYDRNRKPFGNLITCNDDTLVGGETMRIIADRNLEIMLLPLVGAIELSINGGKPEFIDICEAKVFSVSANDAYEITNPYDNELVNFLHIRFTRAFGVESIKNRSVYFNIDTNKHTLQNIGANCYIGKFAGREEGFLILKPESQGVFGFVIEGAFEFQNRLLEARDSIALWNDDNDPLQIEFEALSNDAILLIIEVKTMGGILI
ncbi:pirin family protein [Emticicia soli]|uniref:Quercetin 2,3-dioxygenase C-terminal cupin domain-containing protein n=1 Tax=Emticicia soli TaxID=2027878 RepID=A0ABW5J8R1_9BACT